ncbi:hypothetical protein QBC38DRAFT_427537 [Podospora fimiseda]|uniref:N-acetyltransferase domain-containing protein n=1 Tax=Podospora fimiseda TaxID=252190 RepID=A0AAN6YPX2_9PEZI|nr:hypothetical protein QBC38DRAFT_427537 [Podospora fimiseda]
MSSTLLHPATPSDIPTLASIGHDAFVTNPIDAHWFPLKSVYPQDYKQFFLDDFTLRFVTPGNLTIVVEITATKEIVAYATFVKHGANSQDFLNWNPDTLSMSMSQYKLKRTCLLKTSISGQTDRSACPETLSSYFEEATKTYHSHLQFPTSTSAATPPRPYLEVRALAVHQSHRHKRYAHQLIQWAQTMASKEGIPIFGDATSTAASLYRINGAIEIGRMKLEAKIVSVPGTEEEIKVEETEAVLMVWEGNNAHQT